MRKRCKLQGTPRSPSKQEIYEAEICAFVNRLRVSNSDEFTRKVAEEQFALRAADGAIRNMLYVPDGDQSHYRLYHQPGKQAKDVLGWALRVLHPGKVIAVADAHFPKKWPAWTFYIGTRR